MDDLRILEYQKEIVAGKTYHKLFHFFPADRWVDSFPFHATISVIEAQALSQCNFNETDNEESVINVSNVEFCGIIIAWF